MAPLLTALIKADSLMFLTPAAGRFLPQDYVTPLEGIILEMVVLILILMSKDVIRRASAFIMHLIMNVMSPQAALVGK